MADAKFDEAVERIHKHFLTIFMAGPDQQRMTHRDLSFTALEIVRELTPEKIMEEKDLEACALAMRAQTARWPNTRGFTKALKKWLAPRDDGGEYLAWPNDDRPFVPPPKGTPGPDGIIRGKGWYTGWKPEKSRWDGRWHGLHRDSPPEHRRPKPAQTDYVNDVEWERLFVTQEAACQHYFARDSEAQELARVAAIGGWEQQLAEFVFEYGRLPSDHEEAKLRAKSKRLSVDIRDNMQHVGQAANELRELRTKALGYWRRLIGLEA